MMKKMLSILLVFAMVFSMSFTAMASEVDNTSVQETEIYTSEVFYYDAETGEFSDENGEPYAFEDIEFEFPAASSSNEDGISPVADLFELYIVRGGLQKTSSGKFTWWFNVDCPTSPFDKPNITLSAQVKGNFTDGSSFSNVENPKTHTYDTNADYGEDYTWTTTAKTGYYYLRYTLTDHEVGQTQYRSTDTELWNRTGHLWDFSFSAVGKTLPMPRADWVKGTNNKRPSNLADTYYATYQDETGIILIRALYDVHHIQPLSYGGSNDYSNLIHLPKDLHSQVTGWFNGY